MVAALLCGHRSASRYIRHSAMPLTPRRDVFLPIAPLGGLEFFFESAERVRSFGATTQRVGRRKADRNLTNNGWNASVLIRTRTGLTYVVKPLTLTEPAHHLIPEQLMRRI